MGEYHINGMRRLSGEIRAQGGKNAILPILASVVLNGGESVIHNCPDISDMHIALDILRSIGCKAEFSNGTIVADSGPADNFHVPSRLVSEMRSSIIFLGGILGRFGQVEISHPGGCELGQRSIGFHIKALREMGVEIHDEAGFLVCRADKIYGARINLDFPSVGATENIMLAAVLAEGETTISNAAREPEIVDLQGFLNAMGANISGAGSGKVIIQGVKSLHNVEYTVMPDRIVAGTYLTAAAITGGDIMITGVVNEHIYPIIEKLAKTGCCILEGKSSVYLKAPKEIKPIDTVRTHPHPGFPTDLQPQLMAYLSCAKGTSIIYETIFESRNKHIHELMKLGADVIMTQDGSTFIIKGVHKLNGAVVEAQDLRGGAALILAGLAAEGKTIVKNSKHVERGYDRIENVLKNLGADIKYYE